MYTIQRDNFLNAVPVFDTPYYTLIMALMPFKEQFLIQLNDVVVSDTVFYTLIMALKPLYVFCMATN